MLQCALVISRFSFIKLKIAASKYERVAISALLRPRPICRSKDVSVKHPSTDTQQICKLPLQNHEDSAVGLDHHPQS